MNKRSFKLFEKVRLHDGTRTTYFCGIKIFSYNRNRPSKFKLFKKVRMPDGTRAIYFFGLKIFSYKSTRILNEYKKIFEPAGYKLSLESDGIHIIGNDLHITGTADNTFWTAQAVFLNNEYDFESNGHEYIVFDIGLNIGLTSLHLAKKDFVTNIYSFEPFVPTFNIARRNMELNPKLSNKIKIFNFGLSDHNDVLDIGYNPDLPGTMSSIPDKESTQKHSSKEQIKLKIASDVLQPTFEKHSDKKIMIKMDVEGAEREILPNLADSGLLAKVDTLIMEYHDGYYKPLVKILRDSGMQVTATEPSQTNVGTIKAYR